MIGNAPNPLTAELTDGTYAGYTSVGNDCQGFSGPIEGLVPAATHPPNAATVRIAGMPEGKVLDNFFNLGFAVTNASRKAFLGLLGNNQANNLNTNGLALFDAAVAWVLPSVPPVRPVLAATAGPGARQMTLGWTSSGTLKTATNLAAPAWITAPSQANPQTVPTTNPQRYYRVKQ